MSTPQRAAPTWLYGVVSLPFGVAAGFAQFAMPFLLRRVGVPPDDINVMDFWIRIGE
jgi:hypothetical protein